MRHQRQTKRFNRNPKERQAMLENIVSSLLRYQTIKTTVHKAKAAKRLADHVITLGKENSLAAKRRVFSYLQDHELTSKIFTDVAPRFKNRKGGYTRILQLQNRKGDGAQMALLELTEKEIKVKEAPKKKEKHDHKHHDHEHHDEKPAPKTKSAPPVEGGPATGKHPVDSKREKQNPGFFKNLGKFFRNKGGS